MEEPSKSAGFSSESLGLVTLQGDGNASFEMVGEEGLDIIEEFYTDEYSKHEQKQPDSKTNVRTETNQGKDFVQDIQQGLKRSVQALN